jgi:hypothetical protein
MGSLIAWAAASVLVSFEYWLYRMYTTRQVIRHPDGAPYLIRYFLWKPKNKGRGRIYLHHIVASDHDRALHDHPWNFLSIILWGGYFEVADIRQIPLHDEGWETWASSQLGQKNKWHGVGSVLNRGAGWRHRVIVPPGKTAWSLVFTSAKVKSWGFFMKDDSFCPWKKYNSATAICEEEEINGD